MRSREASGCRRGNPACATHVADAMMTCPVCLSTAITDHVAHADRSAANMSMSARRALFMDATSRWIIAERPGVSIGRQPTRRRFSRFLGSCGVRAILEDWLGRYGADEQPSMRHIGGV